MSVTSPGRASARSGGADALVNPYPLRYPESSSPAFMTRRAWWLVVANVLLPGSAQILAGNRRLGRIGLAATLALWVVVILTAALALAWPWMATTVFASAWTLTIAQVLLWAYALLWVVLTLDTLRLARLGRVGSRSRLAVPAVAAVLALVFSGGAVYAAQNVVAPLRSGLGLFASGPSVPPSDGHYNFLLLGADSADGRDSMRYDSISVVSVNADSGAVTIFGIPRDLRHAPFSEGPMQDLYPDGFQGHTSPSCGWGSGINQLTNAVENCREDRGEGIYPGTAERSTSPAIEATKDAAEGVLGIEIPYYVFIDMNGFAALIDALGGVEITVKERLPKGALHQNPDGSLSGISGWIEEGTQRMDGDTAQWYARSRYTTSDWDRMRRQRELQQAILDQATPSTVLTRFSEVVEAGTHLVQTDIPDSLLPYLLDLALKAKEQGVQDLELTPKGVGIDPEDPSADDWQLIRDRVDELLHPPSEAPDPED